MKKKIVCIRHGKALHNVLFKKIGKLAYSNYRDTPLVLDGIKQTIELAQTWNDRKKIDLVIVSPTSRTLDTATNIFYEKNVKMIALDCTIEFPNSDYCNKRNDLLVLKTHYPHVDFSYITEEEYNKPNIETVDQLKDRINTFKKFVLERKEENIAFVNHSSFLKCMMGMEIGDEKNELNHCHVYNFDIEL